MILSYFEGVVDGFEYLIALGSIIGVLGFVVTLVFMILGSSRHRKDLFVVMIICFILMAVCGVQTGINYFHLNF